MSTRDRILERRAKFISTALVLAAGCSREQGNGASKLPEAESKPATSVTAVQAAGPVKPPPDRPSVDPKVSAAGVTRRTQMVEFIEKVHAATAKLASSVPAPCAFGHEECKARFVVFTDEWARIKDELRGFYPRCPAKLPDDVAIDKMLSEHHRWLTKWLAAIELAGRSAIQGDSGTEWDDLLQKAADAHPQPCLKYYCP